MSFGHQFTEPKHIRLEQLAKARRGGWAVSLYALLFQRRRWSPIKRHSSKLPGCGFSQGLVVLNREGSTCRSYDHCCCDPEPRRCRRDCGANILQGMRFVSTDHVVGSDDRKSELQSRRSALFSCHPTSGPVTGADIDRAKSTCDIELFRRRRILTFDG
jgi:hypothetical protein